MNRKLRSHTLNQYGFSLMQVMVSVGVLSIVSLSSAQLFKMMLVNNKIIESKNTASGLLQTLQTDLRYVNICSAAIIKQEI